MAPTPNPAIAHGFRDFLRRPAENRCLPRRGCPSQSKALNSPAVIPEAARSKPLEIWFQDEARIGQKGTLAYIWARQGTRPRAVQDTRYISAYIYGAICPERGVGAGLVMPKANAEGLNDHLAEIEKAVTPGAHAVLIMDGAGWHNSKDLTVPSNISLLKLPAYSPELNPVENVWQFLRRNKLAHRLYDTYEAITDACCDAWNFLMVTPERIRSIGTRDWANVS